MKSTIDVGQQWVWILDVIFGGIITLGYQKLETSLLILVKQSRKEFIRHIFISVSFLVFVIYDVGVYHILVFKNPFQISLFSACRYVLDLVMSFNLLMILMRSLNYLPEQNGKEILVSLTIWHLSAACWHMLASMEKTHKLPSVASFAPHFIFVASYWALLLVIFFSSKQHKRQGVFAMANTSAFLTWLAGFVIFISIYRSIQIIKVYF